MRTEEGGGKRVRTRRQEGLRGGTEEVKRVEGGDR